MKLNILITSSSFINTEGRHKHIYNDNRINIIEFPGPNIEKEMLKVISNIDGVICGDDEFTDKVILKGVNSKLKVISLNMEQVLIKLIKNLVKEIILY